MSCFTGETDNPFLSEVTAALRRLRPRLSRWVPYQFRSEMFPGGRMGQLWFLTGGCQWDACTMCDYGHGPAIGVSEMAGAVAQGLDELRGLELTYLEVSPAGSMLDPNEVPTAARQRIFALMRDFPVDHVLFETRAETVKEPLVAEVRDAFPEQAVGVMIGLESANPWVQRFCVNKGSRPEWFERAAERFHAQGIEVIANVSLGTAFLSPEEAITDAVATVRWSLDHGADWAVLYPLQVKPYTLLAELHRLDAYHSPSFWSLVEALHRLGPDFAERTTMAWYKNYYDQPFIETVTSCPACHDRVLDRLDDYHASQSFAVVRELEGMDCTCKQAWRDGLRRAEPTSPARLVETYQRIATALGLDQEWAAQRGTCATMIEEAFVPVVPPPPGSKGS